MITIPLSFLEKVNNNSLIFLLTKMNYSEVADFKSLCMQLQFQESSYQRRGKTPNNVSGNLCAVYILQHGGGG